jgi:hypothetical protein
MIIMTTFLLILIFYYIEFKILIPFLIFLSKFDKKFLPLTSGTEYNNFYYIFEYDNKFNYNNKHLNEIFTFVLNDLYQSYVLDVNV